jgi:transposase-like protein
MGNIVYNGTHRIKEEIIVKRFLCKACGKSFCSRSRSIFYGLRSPEEKIRQALNLLAKGMSMRGVGRTLGVKAATVRHWHKASA